jgi:hypothetical protein
MSVVTVQKKRYQLIGRNLLVFLCPGLIVALTFSYVVSGTAQNYRIVVPLLCAYLILSSVVALFICLASGAVSLGVLLAICQSAGFSPAPSHVQVVFVSLLLLYAIIARNKISIPSQTLIKEISSIFLIVISGFLVTRWPLDTKLQQLSFLAYEDNAAWILTASKFSMNHSEGYVRGLGGYVLDPLMYLLYILNGSIEGTKSSLSAYTTVTNSYAVLEFLAISTAGLWVFIRLSKNYVSQIAAVIAALGCLGMSYAALQLPRSTGHLTFIGAICFVWLLLLSSNLNYSSASLHSLIATGLVIGIVGMWWPFLAVVLVAALLYVLLNYKKVKLSVKTRDIGRSKIILACALFGVLGFLFLPIALESFTALSIREFLTTSGGVQNVPGNSLLVGVLGIATVSLLSPKNSAFDNALVPVISLGIFVVLLYFASAFTGPDFVPKYTYLKTLLLFTIAMIPITALAIADFVGRFDGPKLGQAVLVALLIFAIGNTTTGWDINNPRQFTAPRWGSALQRQSEKNPKAYILCSTSNPLENLEAYICSRHAAALQNNEDDISGDWRFLQLYPSLESPESRERAKRLQGNVNKMLDRNEEVFILSFEAGLTIAEEDKWWMSSLNLSGLDIVPLD